MNAIPTKLNGIQFRSRLEAKWAIMFDLLGWRWEYEPIDLDGYIPDFILFSETERHILVEVKPALTYPELSKFISKPANSGWKGEILMLGATTWPTREIWSGGVCLGMLGELTCDKEDSSCYWFEEAVLFRCAKCSKVNFLHALGGWEGRICGHYDGDHYLGEFSSQEFNDLWAEAGNMTQWKPKRIK